MADKDLMAELGQALMGIDADDVGDFARDKQKFPLMRFHQMKPEGTDYSDPFFTGYETKPGSRMRHQLAAWMEPGESGLKPEYEEFTRMRDEITSGFLRANIYLAAISKAQNKIVEASPHLQASMKLMGRTIDIALRPIGDVMSMFLRPFAISMLQHAIPWYAKAVEWIHDPDNKEMAEGMGRTLTMTGAGAGAGMLFAGPKGAILGGALGLIASSITGLANIIGNPEDYLPKNNDAMEVVHTLKKIRSQVPLLTAPLTMMITGMTLVHGSIEQIGFIVRNDLTNAFQSVARVFKNVTSGINDFIIEQKRKWNDLIGDNPLLQKFKFDLPPEKNTSGDQYTGPQGATANMSGDPYTGPPGAIASSVLENFIDAVNNPIKVQIDLSPDFVHERVSSELHNQTLILR